jgi:hypothetical protein
MDEATILALLRGRLDLLVVLNQTTLTVACEEWDRSLRLPIGATALFIDKAIQGTPFSIALRSNQLIRLALSHQESEPPALD